MSFAMPRMASNGWDFVSLHTSASNPDHQLTTVLSSEEVDDFSHKIDWELCMVLSIDQTRLFGYGEEALEWPHGRTPPELRERGEAKMAAQASLKWNDFDDWSTRLRVRPSANVDSPKTALPNGPQKKGRKQRRISGTDREDEKAKKRPKKAR
ncbi:MAG: hypothetical protein M1829_005082 [Trizodia sp. TS-e1964]|nr:MAG: hypothetical protein M1829_005082 [Trizodia sp. TS-e1964]